MLIAKLQRELSGFHRNVWILFWGSLVNAIGGFMIRPFMALYLYEKLGASTVGVGLYMAVSSSASLVSGMIGGSLCDRFGRKRVMVFTLVGQSLVLASFALARTFSQFLVLGFAMSMVGSLFSPASNASIADVTPSERRAQAYGFMRIAINVGAAVGPLAGALLVTRSYQVAFIFTSITTLSYATAIFLLVSETRPSGVHQAGPKDTPEGYRLVLRDLAFLVFISIGVLVGISYSQIETTLPIYMKAEKALNESHYGALLALNGAMVVFLQLPITWLVAHWRVSRTLAVSNWLYAFGFAGFGFAQSWEMMILAMVVVTMGEMVGSPSYTKFVADIAPADLRGRYMALSAVPWLASGIVGPMFGGAIMSALGGTAVWYTVGVFCLSSGTGYLLLERLIARRRALVHSPPAGAGAVGPSATMAGSGR